ncbi:MAG: hypothetical protein WA738_05255 [Candidatus Angelobacter sp.]
MTSANWFWGLLAWASLPLLAVLASVLIWRRLQREFPFFLSYVAVAFLVGVIRFVVYKTCSPTAYFYVFWCTDVVVVLAALLAIYETFLRRIFPGFAAVRFYRYLFPAAAVVIAFLGFLTALYSADTRAAFLITSRVLDFIRSAVIGFFVAVILFMGRQFSGHEFSIAAGFGLQAAVALANAALRTRMQHAATTLDRFEPLAFDISCLIWLWSFSQTIKPSLPKQTEELHVETLHQAKKWEEVLKDFLTSSKR